MPVIRTPDGQRIRIPDDATPEQINTALALVGGPPAKTDEYDPTAGMSGWEKFMAGAGSAAESNIRGVKQLYHSTLGDESRVPELEAQEEEARRLNAPLLGTGAGRAGQIAGELATFLIPGGAVTKAAKLGRLGVIGTGLAEGALGAGLGASQATTGGESRLTNTLIGGATGGTLGSGGALLNPKAGFLQQLLKRGAEEGSPLVKKVAGKAIGKLVEPVRGVKVDKSEMADVLRNYGSELPPALKGKLEDITKRKYRGTILTGPQAQEMRSVATAIGRDQGSSAAAKAGANRVQRSVDKATNAVMSKPRAYFLRHARTAARTGEVPGVLTKAGTYRTPTAIELMLRASDPDAE